MKNETLKTWLNNRNSMNNPNRRDWFKQRDYCKNSVTSKLVLAFLNKKAFIILL